MIDESAASVGDVKTSSVIINLVPVSLTGFGGLWIEAARGRRWLRQRTGASMNSSGPKPE
jgi:hypothetical protein